MTDGSSEQAGSEQPTGDQPGSERPDARGPDARGPDARGPDARGPDAGGTDTGGSDTGGEAQPLGPGSEAKDDAQSGAGRTGPASTDTTPEPPAPRRRRRVLLVAAGLALVLVAAGVAAAGLYVRSVDLGEPVTLPATTTVYYSDGTTVLVRLGNVQRSPVPYDDLLPAVIDATVAADDPGFWGGTATAITRGYVRHAYEVPPGGMQTRVRTAVLAWKLEQRLSKEEILAGYLNVVPYGRMAYGIEAAARAYFGKSARRGAAEPLTVAEAIALAAMPSQPEPDPADPQGRPGFDPTRGDAARANAEARFAEIRDAMVDLGTLTAEEAAALSYPQVRPYDPDAVAPDVTRPAGLVVNHVLAELTRDNPASPWHGLPWEEIANGGYDIVTTIDARAQAAVEAAADPGQTGSVLEDQPENLVAAAVMVEPGTGRVLAYYGGPDGTGIDHAGVYTDEDGQPAGSGAHPPAGTFHVHTLAAALQNGYSLRSRWNAAPHDMPGRTGPNQVRISSRCPTGNDICTLVDSTVAGLSTTFYAITVSVGVEAVLRVARDAGVRHIWDNELTRYETADPAALTPSLTYELGIGQYPVTVVDQANAMATYAAGGQPASAHFVRTVARGEEELYSESLPAADAPRVLNQPALDDLTWTLSRTAAGRLPGRDSASLTGTWQYGASAAETAHAWTVGYTSALAMAVWVGDASGGPIRDASGVNIYGATVPAAIYRQAMTAAHDALGLQTRPFNPPAFAGTTSPPGAVPG